MQSDIQIKKEVLSINLANIGEEYLSAIHRYTPEAWKKIAPLWPLKNFIAVNPLQGLEDLSFEQAIMAGQSYFQQNTIPKKMEDINRETIKWCQAFFDDGQATITMPFRDQGLYRSWRKLARYDKNLLLKKENHIWLENLPTTAEQAIAACLVKLNIPLEEILIFFTLLLTTLPGWANYIKYKTEWGEINQIDPNPVTKADYLAMRLVITTLLWPEAINLLEWHQGTHTMTASEKIQKITNAENNYQKQLFKNLSGQNLKSENKSNLADAQLVFCIDVRSEPLRRTLEAQGNYETFGFAGFFGIPTQVNNELTGEIYTSCPVLIRPKHTVKEIMICSDKISKRVNHGKDKINNIKKIYQGLKYTFTTPFALAELIGPWCGLWMLAKTISSNIAINFKKKLMEFILSNPPLQPTLTKKDETYGIDFNDQCHYAESALRIMGFTANFSPLIVLCGHGSITQNNAYASALDCGACGGNQGAANARILAAILNDMNVRKYLIKKDIFIPLKSRFIAALHTTTTDEVTLYLNETEDNSEKLNKLKNDLDAARKINNNVRHHKMNRRNTITNKRNYVKDIIKRSTDWSQTLPEWGLARNASFIIAPRFLTKQIDLDGRTFLHSYDWEQDKDGNSLTTILTAPLIVAQWINSQYLFSTIDNVAYGSGSKITHNITGKIGVMQGNGSDLMHGLPLQSISLNDNKAYHEPLRLIAIVYAPHNFVGQVICNQQILRKLFGNQWISLACVEPESHDIYFLKHNLIWTKL